VLGNDAVGALARRRSFCLEVNRFNFAGDITIGSRPHSQPVGAVEFPAVGQPAILVNHGRLVRRGLRDLKTVCGVGVGILDGPDREGCRTADQRIPVGSPDAELIGAIITDGVKAGVGHHDIGQSLRRFDLDW
jgi:hypothetical protein